jgi:hypothetical protein
MTTDNRVCSGVPAGGQFSAKSYPDTDIQLDLGVSAARSLSLTALLAAGIEGQTLNGDETPEGVRRAARQVLLDSLPSNEPVGYRWLGHNYSADSIVTAVDPELQNWPIDPDTGDGVSTEQWLDIEARERNLDRDSIDAAVEFPTPIFVYELDAGDDLEWLTE